MWGVVMLMPLCVCCLVAVTAGPLKDQRGVKLGFWDDPIFARSVMENFLGMYPVDHLGKHSVGNGALYVANGFEYALPSPL